MSAPTQQTTGHRGGPRGPRPGMRAEVLDTWHLTPGLVRVVVGGPGLAPFQPSPHADSYVKLLFVPGTPDGTGAQLLAQWTLPDGRIDLDAARAALPPEQRPRTRTYTVRAVDPDAHSLTLDLVVHGASGLAGPWADRARPGDEVILLGPGGGYSPDPTAEHHLLAGDASALPAIAVALERLPPATTGHAVIEVAGPQEQIDLTGPERVMMHWVHTDGKPGTALVRAVRELPWPAGGRVQSFVHGEAGAVRELRRYLRVERRQPTADLSVSGYWRLGADDEAWRAGKREWLRGIEESESAAGLD